jgi:branched-chain amino acid transport system substrate-binding protein
MNKIIIAFVLALTFFNPCPSNLHAEGNIKVAAIFAKTGEASQDNLELFEAVRFAVDEINASGGLHGRQIHLMEYDNQSTPIQSRIVARQAVKDGAVAVIGASWSSHSLAIAPFLQKMKIPMVTPDSTHPDITKAGDYIFRTCFDDSLQGKALSNFARETLKASTAVIIRNITSDYSLGLSKIFAENFSTGGGTVYEMLNFKSQRTDFTDLLKEVKALNPDVLFIPGHSESGFVVRQAQQMGITAKILGADGWPYRQFYANGGQDLKEGYYTAHWSKSLDTEKTRDFIKRYKEVYEVTDFAATTYDAAMLLFDAIRRAESLNPASIRTALAATRDFDGVTGKISFNENGDSIKQVVLMKITDGRPALLKIMTPETETEN